MGDPTRVSPAAFRSAIPAFRRFPLAWANPGGQSGPIDIAPPRSPQMITAFFAFVTVTFLAAIVMEVADSVASSTNALA